jgi:hypothetical protein
MTTAGEPFACCLEEPVAGPNGWKSTGMAS